MSNNSPALDPVILCGPGRSGTSYFRELLNRVPDLHLSFEARMLKQGVRVFRDFEGRQLESRTFQDLLLRLRNAEMESNRNPELAQVALDSRTELYDEWNRQPQYASLMREIYWRAYGCSNWGDKILRAEYLEDLRMVWPGARLLILFRDPRATYASQKKKWGFSPLLTAGYWQVHFNITSALWESGPASAMKVQFENLVRQPVQTLQQVLAFLDSGDSVGAEEAVREVPPKPETLDSWRNTLSESEIRRVEEYCYPGLRALGYEPEIATRARRIPPLGFTLGLAWQYRSHLGHPGTARDKNTLTRLKRMLATLGTRRPGE